MGNRKQRDKTNTKSKSLPNKTNHCHIKQYSSSEDLADQYEYTCRDGRWWMERISLSYGISHHSPVNEEQQNANDNDIIDCVLIWCTKICLCIYMHWQSIDLWCISSL
eukprot:53041_1